MPAQKKPFNQLDPFEENSERFQAQEIRRSSSHTHHNPFADSQKKRKSSASYLKPIYIALILIIISAIVILIFVLTSTNKSQDPTISDNPLVNPAGRDASSEYTSDTNDPDIHLREQNKLSTLLNLISDENWEYANAIFETIFPDYLDTCERYDYYRSAVTLADNFASFSIPRDSAESRMNYLIKECGSSEAK